MKDSRIRALLAVLAVLAAVGVGVTVVDNGPDRQPGQPRATITIHVGKPRAPGAVQTTPTTVTVPKAAVRQAQASDLDDHEGLKDETPPGVPPGEIEAAREQQDRLAANDQLPIVTPDAAPSERGCTSRFVRNYSTRRGVRPRLLVAHYTVSPNRPGWSDVWAVVSLFNTPSFAASSNYVIDGEGHCAYIVRESDKAWAQATANPVAISAEIINSGHEKTLSGPAGLRKIGQVFSDAAKRWGIPLQRGNVNGCQVTRAGIVDHHSLGACGGGHYDISPYGLDQILAAAKAARGGGVTAGDRATCRKLTWWRNHGRPRGAPERNAIRRRRALEHRHVTCRSGTAIRRR